MTFSFPSPSSLLKLPNASYPCGIPSSWYTPCDRSIVTIYFNIYVIHLFSRAQSLKKTCQAWEIPPLLTFDILTRQTVFQCSVSARGSGGIDVFEKILTGSSLLSSRRFSLVHFYCSRSFFVRPH